MQDLSLHLLDIVENSIRAGASTIEILLEELVVENKLKLQIKDNGKGMSLEMQNQVTDPFFTTRTTRRVGLGIPLLKQHCEEAGGCLVIRSQEGVGTHLVAEMQYDHIDRIPLGDLVSTWMALLRLHSEIHWYFEHLYRGREKEKQVVLDTQQIKEVLVDVPIDDPAVLAWVKDKLKTFYS